MASTPITPPPSASGPQGPGAAAPQGGDVTDTLTGMKGFAKIAQGANDVAEQFPELAKQMRDLQTQVRQWTLTAIHKSSTPQPLQATSQI